MKKTMIICIMAAFAACKQPAQKQEKTPIENTADKTVYTCPMHPKVAELRPGTCPKCGMDLVAKED
ncbi:heavy metal-binding domain-containing protein [uncultured Mucilaginibacter sp.]|uniref:heavy metal-binding domain-containing protein n=1 Tax=uncultured Mucilaginibacter sp. TaxID=797541 RepID=UPI0025EA5FF2|nr:heavy metal-binding domain-containing protein [uncultured Mucilaginibacter sp.]